MVHVACCLPDPVLHKGTGIFITSTVSVAYPGFQRGGCLRSGPIREGGVLPASGLIRKVEGMIAYQEDRDIVEFMRTGINRQRKRTAIIIIKRGPKSYEFMYGRTYGRGGCSSTQSTLSGYATVYRVVSGMVASGGVLATIPLIQTWR